MTELLGQTIGNYQIEALLGSGGMGQVFRARHLRLNRQAALKVMHEALAREPNFLARFQLEARAAASLTHPHIVTVYDFGMPEGRAYLAMELVSGGSLRDQLRQQAVSGQGWPLATGIELVRQAAEGLAFAHSQGMVHRDIKPDNLLLSGGTDGEPPTLKIGDFGLARLAEGSHLTATGTAMGTPAYMSPEQCRGGQLDGRSDLYSLGVVLYEVATGRLPFIVKTPYDAVYHHTHSAPPPPRQLRPELPAELEAIILRCLAKQPDERYADAATLAAALHGVLGSAAEAMYSRVVPILPLEAIEGPAPTAVQPPPSADATPPAVATLVGASTRPVVRVLDAQGAAQQVVELRGASLSIGRAPDNDLVLEGAGVSRHHLALGWDGQQVTITDLGAANSTLLAGQPLPRSVAQVWPWRAQVQIGSYWLRLEPPTAPLGATAPLGTTPVPGRTPPLGSTPVPGRTPPLGSTPTAGLSTLSLSQSFVTTERLALRLESTTTELPPGQAVPVRVLLSNRGSAADTLTVRVSGIPEDWVSGMGATLLSPGEQATITLTVLVPPTSESAAGERRVTVRARSKMQPAEGALAEGRWTVLPFAAVALTVAPARAEGRRQAHYRVSVQNSGNAATRYQLTAEDEAGALQYELAPAEVDLAVGQEAAVRLTVGRAARLVGGAVGQRFTVRAETAGEGAEVSDSAAAQFVQPALLPIWSIPALVAIVALAVMCGFGTLPRTLAGQLPFYGVLAAAPVPTPLVTAAGEAPTTAILPTTTSAPLPTNVPPATAPLTVATETAATGTAPPTATGTAAATEAPTAAATAVAQATTAAASGQTTTAAAQQTVLPAAQESTTPTETPTEAAAETPTETPTEVPTAPPTETPTNTPPPPTNTPTNTPANTPTDIPTNTPTPTPKPTGFTTTPPVQDGAVSTGEWDNAVLVTNLPHGQVFFMNDNTNLYLLVDLTGDTTADPPISGAPWGDYFWLTFDVNKNGTIDSNVDINYGNGNNNQSLTISYYLGPGRWTGISPSQSQMAAGYGPSFATQTQHRIWELTLRLSEINGTLGQDVPMGLRTYSQNPSFTDNTPGNFFQDFTNLIKIKLATG